MHIAIIGAGPIGLEAALAAIERGHTVTVFERGRVAENVRDWGHVRLFSPFGMNTSERGRAVLREAGVELPSDEAILTGREFVGRYLEPLSRLPRMANRLQAETDVLSIGRWSLGKKDAIGRPHRAADRFRLRVRSKLDGTDFDRGENADVVLDCSGTYPHHRWLGIGGVPAQGESRDADHVEYRLPDILGADRRRYANRATLVLGGGFSAATTIVALASLAEIHPDTQITWVTPRDRTPPISRIENDPLSERDGLAARANELAMRGSMINWHTDWTIEGVKPYEGRVSVLLNAHGLNDGVGVGCRSYDNVVANVGYKPDRSLYEELQVHECYASQGPMKLAASLLGETSGDCLAMASPGPEALRNPEPNFFILGAKSYGRDSRFLLRTGLQQVEDVFDLFTPTSPA